MEKDGAPQQGDPFLPRFIPHSAALIPLYHWRGARPWLLDLDAGQSGRLVALLLAREGDCAILPVAWQQNSPDDPARFAADALDSDAFSLALEHLQRDGWQVNGRLDLHVSGRHTDPHFWEQIHEQLWRKG